MAQPVVSACSYEVAGPVQTPSLPQADGDLNQQSAPSQLRGLTPGLRDGLFVLYPPSFRPLPPLTHACVVRQTLSVPTGSGPAG